MRHHQQSTQGIRIVSAAEWMAWTPLMTDSSSLTEKTELKLAYLWVWCTWLPRLSPGPSGTMSTLEANRMPRIEPSWSNEMWLTFSTWHPARILLFRYVCKYEIHFHPIDLSIDRSHLLVDSFSSLVTVFSFDGLRTTTITCHVLWYLAYLIYLSRPGFPITLKRAKHFNISEFQCMMHRRVPRISWNKHLRLSNLFTRVSTMDLCWCTAITVSRDPQLRCSFIWSGKRKHIYKIMISCHIQSYVPT